MRRVLGALPRRFDPSITAKFSSSSSSPSPAIPTLYSFLQPSIFALRPKPKPHLGPIPVAQPQPCPPPPKLPTSPNPTLAADSLESDLLSSLRAGRTDAAWLAFKSLASLSLSPPPALADALISHLSSLPDRLSLKRAFVATVFLLRKSRSPHAAASPDTFASLFRALAAASALFPALALLRTMVHNRCFPDFSSWGPPLLLVARRTPGGFRAFLRVFEEICQSAMEDGLESMRPDLASCNAVLDGCCHDLGSVPDAERILETMSTLGLLADSHSFESLAHLYASKGVSSRVDELDKLMDALGFSDKRGFIKNLISGYVKAGSFEKVSSTILRAVQERRENANVLDEDSYMEVVKYFLDNERIKELAALIVEAQEVETSQQPFGIDCSVGYGIVNACVALGLLDKAHNIVDEMTAQGASVGLGVYSSILKAYCKEQRTAEAAQLVSEISAAGLQLDVSSYDALIDASMTAQDFQSAFSLFREMREARAPDLKLSYLTIMTGLMENNRPELMASFLDSVVDDPRIEIATHDWNSIIHAFCKVGRLEDARKTYRRMIFLRFEPNGQTYLSLINGYVLAEKYFSVLILWTELRRKGAQFDHGLIDALLYALVKGGFFDAAMQVVEKAQELKIFVDKWRHKQAFMETHKKLKVAKLRKRNFRKMEALVAFKNWAGLNA